MTDRCIPRESRIYHSSSLRKSCDSVIDSILLRYHHNEEEESAAATMWRNVCVTAAEGYTGFLIAELLLTDENFQKEIGTVTGLAMNTSHDHCKDLQDLGATIVEHKPGKLKEIVKTLQDTKADTLCLVPSAHKEKIQTTTELINAAKQAGIPNVLFISSAGCDLAEREKQPRLREFIDLETLFMASKGDPGTATGHSPVIIRCVFFFYFSLLSFFQKHGAVMWCFCY